MPWKMYKWNTSNIVTFKVSLEKVTFFIEAEIFLCDANRITCHPVEVQYHLL